MGKMLKKQNFHKSQKGMEMIKNILCGAFALTVLVSNGFSMEDADAAAAQSGNNVTTLAVVLPRAASEEAEGNVISAQVQEVATKLFRACNLSGNQKVAAREAREIFLNYEIGLSAEAVLTYDEDRNYRLSLEECTKVMNAHFPKVSLDAVQYASDDSLYFMYFKPEFSMVAKPLSAVEGMAASREAFLGTRGERTSEESASEFVRSLDANSSGKIARSEFKRAAAKLRPLGLPL